MSVSIGSFAPQPSSLAGRSNRTREDAGAKGLIPDQSRDPDTASSADADAVSSVHQPRAGVSRLSESTLTALADASSSAQQPSASTGSGSATSGSASEGGKRVPIDFIHVELPNGAKFELRHVPGDGESSSDALNNLLKAAEELSKLLGGNLSMPTSKDEKTQSGDAATSAYAKQLSTYTKSLTSEVTTVTA